MKSSLISLVYLNYIFVAKKTKKESQSLMRRREADQDSLKNKRNKKERGMVVCRAGGLTTYHVNSSNSDSGKANGASDIGNCGGADGSDGGGGGCD